MHPSPVYPFADSTVLSVDDTLNHIAVGHYDLGKISKCIICVFRGIGAMNFSLQVAVAGVEVLRTSVAQHSILRVVCSTINGSWSNVSDSGYNWQFHPTPLMAG